MYYDFVSGMPAPDLISEYVIPPTKKTMMAPSSSPSLAVSPQLETKSCMERLVLPSGSARETDRLFCRCSNTLNESESCLFPTTVRL